MLVPDSTDGRTALTRRGLLATMGAAALLLPLAGCDSFLGITDPNASDDADSSSSALDATGPSVSTENFDGMAVSLTTDTTQWSWSVVENAASAYNGSVTMAIPVSFDNTVGETDIVLSKTTASLVGPDGAELPNLADVTVNDVLDNFRIASGSTASGILHVLYAGPGSYRLDLDNLLGTKASVPFEVPSASDLGIRALPSSIGSVDASDAVPSGSSFDAEGLTLMLSADRDSYAWVQISSADQMAGVWCVGVPVTIANNSTVSHQVTAAAYVKFNPSLALQGDPSAYFVDDFANLGPIAAGASATAKAYFIYEGDGNYYLAMDNNGTKVIATALIAQYY